MYFNPLPLLLLREDAIQGVVYLSACSCVCLLLCLPYFFFQGCSKKNKWVGCEDTSEGEEKTVRVNSGIYTLWVS